MLFTPSVILSLTFSLRGGGAFCEGGLYNTIILSSPGAMRRLPNMIFVPPAAAPRSSSLLPWCRKKKWCRQFFNVSTNSTDASSADELAFNSHFALLYTVYSVPNTVLPFFGGFFVDKLGVRKMLILFSVFVTAGQAVFAFGMQLHPMGGQ